MGLNYSRGGRAMANIKLRVTGMTCGHCQAKVEKALKSVSGVYSAVIDLPDGEAEVDFDDDRITTDQLVAAVGEGGHRGQKPRQYAPRLEGAGPARPLPSST